MILIFFKVYKSIPLLLNNATRIHVRNKDSQTTKFPTLTIALIAVALLFTTFITAMIGKYHISSKSVILIWCL